MIKARFGGLSFDFDLGKAKGRNNKQISLFKLDINIHPNAL